MQNQLRSTAVCSWFMWLTIFDNMLPSAGCFQPVKKKHRARVLEFFIDVAQECFNIGNFNSLMAIISEYMHWVILLFIHLFHYLHWNDFTLLTMFYCVAGMNMNPVSRLKKTWNKVNTDKFDILVVRKLLWGREKNLNSLRPSILT